MIHPKSPLRFLLYPSLGEVREHVKADLFGRALSARLGRPVMLEWAPHYEMLEAELAAGRVDLAWATSEQCTAFGPRYRAVLRAVRSGSSRYHAGLVCRASEPLTLESLRGKRAAWVAPRSTGGHLLPKRFLREQGLEPDTLFGEQRFHGTYRKALQAVLTGEADVASTSSNLADEHSMRATLALYVGSADEPRLIPFAFTPSAPADGLLLSPRLSEQEAATLISLLTRMGTDGSGLERLMGPFRAEGFHLEHGAAPSRGDATPPAARDTEYLVAELDATGRCHRLWSPSGRAFGRDVTGAEGRPLVEVLGPEAGPPLVTLARTVRGSGVGGRMEHCVEVEGRTRWYAAEVAPCAAPPGEAPSRWSLLVRDVSGMRQLEEPLYRLASFPLLHPEPLLELSEAGELRYANPIAHKAFPDLQGEGPRHPLVQTAQRWAWRGADSGEPAPTVQLAGHSWELTVAQLWDPPGLRVFARDVTLRKQLEARLIQADRLSALGSLAAAVGHEMNNPLAFMLANLSFAREELERVSQSRPAGEPDLELGDVLEALSETAQGALRLKNIVQDLHTLSRKPPEHRALVDVRPLLENALKLLRGELHQRARLERDFHDVHAVDADEARLSQLFLNLLINAMQSMEPGNCSRNVLRVAAYTGQEGEVVVEVQDTGRGLPPEALSRIFEPFVSQRTHGTGLGLSVSHAIVTSLGGSLRAESREGRGTLLTIVLPSASEDVLPRHALMTA